MRALWSDKQNCSHNVSQKVQRISENSRRLWLFVGCVRGFPRRTPGKSRENSWKIFPESRNAINSRISGTGKGKPAGNLGSTLPGPCPNLPCGVFFEIDSSSLLEFFWVSGPFLIIPSICPLYCSLSRCLESKRARSWQVLSQVSDTVPPKMFMFILKFQRVTIRGAQPSARLSEEICLSEGSAGVSPRALRGLSEGSAGSLRGSAGFSEGFRG